MSRRYLIRSRHRTVFYVRVHVPAVLQQLIGKAEIRRSLGEVPPTTARLRAAAIGTRLAEYFDSIIRELRSQSQASPARTPMKKHSPATIGAAIEEIIRSPDGTVTLKGVQTDPLHHEAEMAAH